VLLQLLQWQQGCCHCSSLFLSTLTFSHSQFSHSCSQIIASFIGKHGEPLQHICQHGGVNKALNHGINYGTIHASTKHSTKHSGGWGICHNNGNFLTHRSKGKAIGHSLYQRPYSPSKSRSSCSKPKKLLSDEEKNYRNVGHHICNSPSCPNMLKTRLPSDFVVTKINLNKSL